LQCGSELTSSNKKFCNKQCYDKFRYAKQEYTCPVCKKIFLEYPRTHRVYCSKKCYYVWKTGKTYEEIFGEENGLEYRKNKKGLTKGKTNAEIFGEKRAKEISDKISKGRKTADLTKHPKEVSRYIKQFEKDGFRCIRLDERSIPDFIAIQGKDVKAFAIEVQLGPIQTDRYVGINDYDDIYWIVIRSGKREMKSDRQRKTLRKLPS
jgi:hypothetical protein